MFLSTNKSVFVERQNIIGHCQLLQQWNLCRKELLNWKKNLKKK